MADDISNFDELKDENQSLNSNVSDEIEQADTDNHSSMWWLNIRRRCHKHNNLKRNLIRRKH
ncbi:hypothetical protein [Thalassomonas sp. M1454]|uniref:hypothetical protein n=1 Tax=Thalassomonas sp. M1454 TaxID=2594477 RepID=UPI001181720B|nr:hypothetical protein [Thalassomonas sp. M1454]TRX56334.1 hypothetical protein FNN08_02030 [Thalassomonas sp. M1454]